MGVFHMSVVKVLKELIPRANGLCQTGGQFPCTAIGFYPGGEWVVNNFLKLGDPLKDNQSVH